jgi:hypothetical protein
MSNPFSRQNKTNKSLRIRISDPWDFRVEGGDNSVICDFLETVRDDVRERWLVRARSVLVAPKGQRGTLVIVSNRHAEEKLVGIWTNEEVSANFGLVPEDAEPCAPEKAVSKSIPLGIGSVVAE